MFFKAKQKESAEWVIEDGVLRNTKKQNEYAANKLFGCFNREDSKVTIWNQNKFLVTIGCSEKAYSKLCEYGFRQCEDYIPDLITTSFEDVEGKTWVINAEDYYIYNTVNESERFECAEINTAQNSDSSVSVFNLKNSIFKLEALQAAEFISALKIINRRLNDGMSGDALIEYQVELRQTKLLLELEEASRLKQEKRALYEADDFNAIILTTESISPFPVDERLGIVSAECAYGMNLFLDVFTSFSDVFGGRSNTTQNALKKAKETVLRELRREAFEIGADAVVAVDLDYSEMSGGGKSMLFLVASGTAIKIKSET